MKSKIIILLIVSAIFSSFTAQNCKYKINEIDKFTNKYTKLTYPERVIHTFATNGLFSVKKIDSSYFFIFDYYLGSYSNFEPYSVKKSAQLIFLLESGETITINSADDINGTKKIAIGLPPVYFCYLTNVSYPVTKNKIDMLLKSKVKSIRFYKTESNGKEDYTDNEIKEKNQDDIQNLIKCVI
jgi:hypothetical protein